MRNYVIFSGGIFVQLSLFYESWLVKTSFSLVNLLFFLLKKRFQKTPSKFWLEASIYPDCQISFFRNSSKNSKLEAWVWFVKNCWLFHNDYGLQIIRVSKYLLKKECLHIKILSLIILFQFKSFFTYKSK